MAYTTATVLSKEQIHDTVRLIVWFTGNAGEPEVRREYAITIATTLTQLQQWAYQMVQGLGPLISIADQLEAGSDITLEAPPPPPVPTAFEVWHAKALRMARMDVFNLLNLEARSEAAALRADVNATYQAGFIADV